MALPVCGAKGPNLENVSRLFHGADGVVPLSGRSFVHSDNLETQQSLPPFNPLAAKAATISLSAFGPGGPFSFHSFSKKWKNQKPKSRSSMKESTHGLSMHEAMSNECLQTGTRPIAKSYRAGSSGLPPGTNALIPSPGVNFKCPPAVLGALAQMAIVKNLRPQPLTTKFLAIGDLCMRENVPLGIWREQTEKLSPSCFAAIPAAGQFIAMPWKCVLMLKTAVVKAIQPAAPQMAVLLKCVLMRKMDMAFTIGAFVLGLFVGAIAVRCLLKPAAKASCKFSGSEMVELNLEARG